MCFAKVKCAIKSLQCSLFIRRKCAVDDFNVSHFFYSNHIEAVRVGYIKNLFWFHMAVEVWINTSSPDMLGNVLSHSILIPLPMRLDFLEMNNS